VTTQTFKTHFEVTTYANEYFRKWGERSYFAIIIDTTLDKIQFEYDVLVAQGQKSSIKKIGGYTVSLNHKTHFLLLKKYNLLLALGYDQLLEDQKKRSKFWDV
jgi:maltose phosphorylase